MKLPMYVAFLFFFSTSNCLIYSFKTISKSFIWLYPLVFLISCILPKLKHFHVFYGNFFFELQEQFSLLTIKFLFRWLLWFKPNAFNEYSKLTVQNISEYVFIFISSVMLLKFLLYVRPHFFKTILERFSFVYWNVWIFFT